jgi:4-alpha-glucanotransferase
MWSVFQIQDLLGIDDSLRSHNPYKERINVPANPENHWNYRMHLTLEALLNANKFNEDLSSYINASGR